MSDVDSPAFIGKRQEHFNCEVKTNMEFYPEKNGEEAGITVYLNSEQHYDFFIARMGGKCQLAIRRVVGDMCYIASKEDILAKPVILSISADKYEYTFSYGYGKDSVKALNTARTQFVSTEAGILGFVGVYFGLYATGNGKRCTVPAYFDWFEYNVLE